MKEAFKWGSFTIRKNTLFGIIAFLIPVLFFLILELFLRLFNYGNEFPLFVSDPIDKNYLHMNYAVTKRYFSNNDFATTGHYNLFLKNKTSNTFRIFVQGESSAAGFPFDHGGSFHFMLEKRLQETFPDKNIEIINTGLTAVCSYTLLDFADEIIAQKPDAILIYTGHNEYYGVLGVGSSQKLGRIYGIVQLYLYLKKIRLVQLLRAAYISLSSIGQTARTKGNSTLMEKMVSEQTIPYDSPLYQLGLKQFSRNLDKLLDKYTEKKIPVFIGDLVSNEKDQAPFISSNKVPKSSPTDDFQTLKANSNADTASAMKHYLYAKELYRKSDFVSAAVHFTKAKDYDELRFRAPEAFNVIIKEKALKYHCNFVPVKSEFESHETNGIIGKELMMEHLHPNIEGYFLLSDAFYESMRKSRLIGNWEHYIAFKTERPTIPVTEVDSMYGSLLTAMLMDGWPFKTKGPMADPFKNYKPKNMQEDLSLLLYYKQISWSKAMSRLYQFYLEQERYPEALKVAHSMILEFKNIYYSFEMAADVYAKMNDYPHADYYYSKAFAMNPSIDLARKKALILLNADRWDDAKKELILISLMNPADDFAKALPSVIDTLQKNKLYLSTHPNNYGSMVKVASSYFKLRKFAEARKYGEMALAINKNQPDANEILKEIKIAESTIKESQHHVH